MSVPAVQEKLNPYLLESPQKVATQLHRKEICFKLLSRICFVALIAIFGAALAISLGLLVPSTAVALVAFSAVLLTPLILPLGLRFQAKSIDCQNKFELEYLVAEKLEEIKDWDQAQIQQFFTDNELSQEHLPREALAKLSPQEPLRALLPLIARAIVYCERGDGRATEEALNAQYPDRFFARAERYKAYFEFETKALPMKLNTALMLHLMEHPFHQEKDIRELGTIEWRYFDERAFNQVMELPAEPYFVAKENGECRDLLFPGLKANPRGVKRLLFING